MKKVGVDTNVVVSFLTDRDPSQQARAAELFGAAAGGEHVVVLPQTVVSESVYVLGNVYAVKPENVSAAMRDLLSLPGVVTFDPVDWPAAWEVWPRSIQDFEDACLVVAATSGAFESLATFDVVLAKRARRQGIASHW